VSETATNDRLTISLDLAADKLLTMDQQVSCW